MGVGKREWSEKRTRAQVGPTGEEQGACATGPGAGRGAGRPGESPEARERGELRRCGRWRRPGRGGSLDEAGAAPGRRAGETAALEKEEGPSSLPLCRLAQ